MPPFQFQSEKFILRLSLNLIQCLSIFLHVFSNCSLLVQHNTIYIGKNLLAGLMFIRESILNLILFASLIDSFTRLWNLHHGGTSTSSIPNFILIRSLHIATCLPARSFTKLSIYQSTVLHSKLVRVLENESFCTHSDVFLAIWFTSWGSLNLTLILTSACTFPIRLEFLLPGCTTSSLILTDMMKS